MIGHTALPRIISLSLPIVGLAYLAGYVFLDWISFIHPFTPYANITPWNPPTGLSFVLVLLFGQRLIPLLFVAPLLGDFAIRELPMPWPVEIVTVIVVGGGYSVALLLLLSPAARFDPALSSMRDLFLLLFAAALSATVVSFGYVGTLMIADLLPSRDLVAAGLRYWVGDVIGIAVVAPFALIFLTRRRLPEISTERAAQLVAIVASLVLVLVYARSSHLQLFYLLFLPIVWIAIRSGLEGVTIGILLTQIGLIFGVQLLSLEEVDLTALQVLLLVLTMTGLVAGAVVTEHRHTELQLRMHQDSLARLARFGSLGELAAAIAHEINQPLTAAGTYARLVVDALASRSVRDPTIADMATKVTAQVDRAAEILRGLRALIRLDKTGRAPSGIDRIVEETLELCRPEFDRYNIEVKVTLDDRLPPVMVNLLQIEQVVLNVLRNAVEAIHLAGHVGGIITIEAVQLGDTTAEIRIHDTGPGFPPQFKADQLPPLSSTKPEGLGIGLSLCRTIVESHGGRLTSGDSTNGAVVRFTLPIAKSSMTDNPIQIALVDDDAAVLDALRLYLTRQRVLTSCFTTADSFLKARGCAPPFDCVVADVRMPGMSGLDLVRHLDEETAEVPVILISGHGDIDMAVGAMKLGAFDFLEKPFDERRLLKSIHHAVRLGRQKLSKMTEFNDLKSRVDSLSERQRQVMEFAAAGLSNKEIAMKLCISRRTVENHRAWMMERVGARNIVELVGMMIHLKARS